MIDCKVLYKQKVPGLFGKVTDHSKAMKNCLA